MLEGVSSFTIRVLTSTPMHMVPVNENECKQVETVHEYSEHTVFKSNIIRLNIIDVTPLMGYLL